MSSPRHRKTRLRTRGRKELSRKEEKKENHQRVGGECMTKAQR